MKALCWNGKQTLGVERVPDPAILAPEDVILRVHLSSTCGSDMHQINGLVVTMMPGDILGHEFMGEVVEVGPEVKKIKKGDRVVVPSVIGCGRCHYCETDQWSLCDNSNTHRQPQELMLGSTTAGIFGYSHAFGGYAGSHAEYVRVPYADWGAFVVPEGVTDEQAVFVSDAVPTGWMAAEYANIKNGDVVAVFGCGGVGQMAIRGAFTMGASRVIAIDRIPERLELAAKAGAEPLSADTDDIQSVLKDMTGGRGPDSVIDAVGMEADSPKAFEDFYDKAKQFFRLTYDRPTVLRHAIMACRKGGTVSVAGVYFGLLDKIPLGAAMNKGLTIRGGQQPGQKFVPSLFEHILAGRLDPSELLSRRVSLDEGPEAYRRFTEREELRPVFDPRL